MALDPKKKRKRKRLKDIQSFEIASVPRGASRGRYIISKEDGAMRLDVNQLTALHSTLGKVVTVCKSGTPTAEAVETLGKDLAQIHSTLGSLLGSDGSFDPVGLKTRIDGIKELATTLSDSTHDLNVRDQLDSLLEQVKDLDGQIAKMQAAPKVAVADAAANASDGTAEGDEGAEGEGAGEGGDAAAGTADATGAGNAVGTDDAAEGAGASADAGDAGDAEGGDGSGAVTTETVTKADLLNFGKQMTQGMTAAIKDLGQMFTTQMTTLKSALGPTNARGAILPGGAGGDGTVPTPSVDGDAHDEKHWGNRFDLNDAS